MQTYARTMVYVSNTDDGEIAVYELNKANGELKTQQTITAGDNVMPLAVSPNKHNLYASVRGKPNAVATFLINQDNGQLTRLAQANQENDICFMQVDATGQYLITSSYGKSAITLSRIEKSGEISIAPPVVYPTGLNAHAVLLDATNHFLFVTNLGSDQILQMLFNATTGEIQPNSPALVKTQTGSGPRHLRFSRDNKFLYTVNEYSGFVSVYAFDKASGTLTEKQSILASAKAFSEKPSAAEIQISPNGRFIYVSERRTNTLTQFSRNAKTGLLTYVQSVPTEVKPRSFAISPDGRYLLSAGQKSGHLSVYKIEKATGNLHFINRYLVGRNPSWVEIVEIHQS